MCHSPADSHLHRKRCMQRTILSTRNNEGIQITKLPVALIATAVASVAAAQTPAVPTAKERQQDVQTTTEASANANTGATTPKQQATNVQKSNQVTKMWKEEKANLAKDASKSNLHPENSSGGAGT